MARRLVSIRRRVGPGAIADYRRSWSAVREAVEARGAHAWAFSSAGDAAEMMEFLEFRAGSDPREDPRVAALLRELDRAHDGVTEEWEEAG
jgi:hypothetical protein